VLAGSGYRWADLEVLAAAVTFHAVDSIDRKKPALWLAAQERVPDKIIRRRKYGLVSALS